ncbi:hypothetical protein ACKC9G_13950 [Pokkaliibacter sp. CJK22405]|uniref:hypothetical protein n=1 Tax=Pokkaliibacter sp. CJK22405 TaxID=3384615 RepID=UPI003984C95E
MRFLLPFFALVVSSSAYCSEAGDVHSDLGEALADPATALIVPRPSIHFVSGAVVFNCEQYLQAKRTSTLAEDVNNIRQSANYLTCDTLALLQQAKASLPVAGQDYGKALAESLDLRSFPSSLAPMLDDDRYTLSRMDNPAVQLSNEVVSYSSEELNFSLQLMALADADGDGVDDWIVWMSDEAKEGNYADYEVLLIHDPQPGKLMTATLPNH